MTVPVADLIAEQQKLRAQIGVLLKLDASYEAVIQHQTTQTRVPIAEAATPSLPSAASVPPATTIDRASLPGALVELLKRGELSRIRLAMAVVFYCGATRFERVFEIVAAFGHAGESQHPRDKLRASIIREGKRNGRIVILRNGIMNFMSPEARAWFERVLAGTEREPEGAEEEEEEEAAETASHVPASAL